MGWFFEISIECGNDELLARSNAAHFEGFSFAISKSLQSTCSAGVINDGDGNWWGIACPSGLSTSGISTYEEAQDMTVAGKHLYERLFSSPPFRYAIAGVETDQFRTFSELKEMDIGLYDKLPGLVLCEETWESVGKPAGFVEFRPGYVWRPYLGLEAIPQHGCWRWGLRV